MLVLLEAPNFDLEVNFGFSYEDTRRIFKIAVNLAPKKEWVILIAPFFNSNHKNASKWNCVILLRFSQFQLTRMHQNPINLVNSNWQGCINTQYTNTKIKWISSKNTSIIKPQSSTSLQTDIQLFKPSQPDLLIYFFKLIMLQNIDFMYYPW